MVLLIRGPTICINRSISTSRLQWYTCTHVTNTLGDEHQASGAKLLGVTSGVLTTPGVQHGLEANEKRQLQSRHGISGRSKS